MYIYYKGDSGHCRLLRFNLFKFKSALFRVRVLLVANIRIFFLYEKSLWIFVFFFSHDTDFPPDSNLSEQFFEFSNRFFTKKKNTTNNSLHRLHFCWRLSYTLLLHYNNILPELRSESFYWSRFLANYDRILTLLRRQF